MTRSAARVAHTTDNYHRRAVIRAPCIGNYESSPAPPVLPPTVRTRSRNIFRHRTRVYIRIYARPAAFGLSLDLRERRNRSGSRGAQMCNESLGRRTLMSANRWVCNWNKRENKARMRGIIFAIRANGSSAATGQPRIIAEE